MRERLPPRRVGTLLLPVDPVTNEAVTDRLSRELAPVEDGVCVKNIRLRAARKVGIGQGVALVYTAAILQLPMVPSRVPRRQRAVRTSVDNDAWKWLLKECERPWIPILIFPIERAPPIKTPALKLP